MGARHRVDDAKKADARAENAIAPFQKLDAS